MFIAVMMVAIVFAYLLRTLFIAFDKYDERQYEKEYKQQQHLTHKQELIRRRDLLLKIKNSMEK